MRAFYFKESVSLTTGFITFCFFNLTVFLISFFGKMFEIFNLTGPSLSWLVAMAVTPTIWILRNKKMKQRAKLFLGFT